MNFTTLNDLNNAKKKINYLLSLKYGNVNNDSEFRNDNINIDAQFTEVLKLINNAYDYIIQMNSFIQFYQPNKKSPYYSFRNTGAYNNFVKIYISFSNSLTRINIIFNEIINKIGYVKPENIQMFFDIYGKYYNEFQQFTTLFFINNDFIVKYYSPVSSILRTDELQQINQIYKSIKIEDKQMGKYAEIINNNYNYIGGKQQNRRTSNNDDRTEQPDLIFNEDA